MNGLPSSTNTRPDGINPPRRLRGTGLVWVLLILLGVAGCGAPTTPAGDAAPTTTPRPVRASGNVVADGVVVPVLEISLSMPVGGIVQEIFVTEGDTVTIGESLLRLQRGRLEADVAQAEAGVACAQARLDELKAGARPEELLVAKAAVDAAMGQLEQIKAGAKPEEVAAAQAGLDGARAKLQQAREGATQPQLIAATAELANSEAALRVAQAAYDSVAGSSDIGRRPEALALEQATNNLNAAKARLEDLSSGARAGDLAAAQAQVRQAQAQLDSLSAPARAVDLAGAQAEIRRAEAQLDLLQAGARPETIDAAEADLASAQAALREAQTALGDTELLAPFAGTVAEIAPIAGEQVTAGEVVVRVADLSSWQVETDDLTELDVVKIKEGAPVSLEFDALPGVQLTGKVFKIKPIGAKKQGEMTYAVIIRPDSYEDRLHWNMTATVTIE